MNGLDKKGAMVMAGTFPGTVVCPILVGRQSDLTALCLRIDWY